jgi:hypothetical protein
MKTTITVKGKVVFDPPDKTKKHGSQSNWKKVAYLEISGDICDYYRWFIENRFSLPLMNPLRGAHITFINDSHKDLGENLDMWHNIKKKWKGKELEVELELTPKTDGVNWWLTVTESSRDSLHGIRTELGLGRPFWGLHMTIGYATASYDEFEEGVEKASRDNIAHSKYIHGLAIKGLLNY